MKFSWPGRDREIPNERPEERIQSKYSSFHELLSLNNECLDLFAKLQEDLQFIPPFQSLVGGRVETVFDRSGEVVTALDRLSDNHYPRLHSILDSLRGEVTSYLATLEQFTASRFSTLLSEVGADAAGEVGAKAAALGEIRNELGLPVPDGFVLTTTAYRRFCGIPLWEIIRDQTRNLNVEDLDGIELCARRLVQLVMKSEVPAVVESDIRSRARDLAVEDIGLAVRSSAVGEGGVHTFANQFDSLLNVPPGGLVDAYKHVVASRFSSRSLFYRLSWGLSEVNTPMAVLFLPTLDAQASGIMYTRDPKNPRHGEIWITSTWGLGLDIASGNTPADLFIVDRSKGHRVEERRLVRKEDAVAPGPGGGVIRHKLESGECEAPSLKDADLRVLADFAVRLEKHFNAPQDVEWVLDRQGRLWVVQARPLILASAVRDRSRARPRGSPVVAGGRAIYPGRASGHAYVVDETHPLARMPARAIVFVERPTPEFVKMLPKMAGFVSKWGNVAGHGAALLREFKVPSIFEAALPDGVKTGDPVSLDAVRGNVYEGLLWPEQPAQRDERSEMPSMNQDLLRQRVLALHLHDPDAFNFRPAGCKSVHDVLRFCHEKAIESMFEINDEEFDRGAPNCRRIKTTSPLNLYVLDLGDGLNPACAANKDIFPEDIQSRPFQALWRGVVHPGVRWDRSAPASLGGFASVLVGSLAEQQSVKRALGEHSYLLVGKEYLNLNARLAYHFSMVDASVSDVRNNNYIAFRFAGGGASRVRRGLRACFLQTVLQHFGYQVDRRGDLVNAWFKKGSGRDTEERLDVLGKLMACSSQLDMYMDSHVAMTSYVEQFLKGNYDLQLPKTASASNRSDADVESSD